MSLAMFKKGPDVLELVCEEELVLDLRMD